MEVDTDETIETMECDSTSPELNPQLAEEMKKSGNQAYGQKDYRLAVKYYTEAIGHNPVDASFYGNRSAAYMMLNQYDLALDDARHCITIDDTFVKGHLRVAKCYMMLGNPTLSIDYYEKALLLQPRNTQAVEEKKQCQLMIHHMEKAQLSFDRKNFRECVFHMDKCLQVSPYCVKFRTMKAEALAMLGRLDDALVLCNDLLRENDTNADAIYVKALSLYYQDVTDRAHQFLQRVLRDDPDHKKAFLLIKRSKQLMKKKDEGNAAFKRGSYQEAYDLYTEGLEIDPYNRITNAKLYCNRSLMAQKLGNIDQSIEDCTKAIELDETYVKAYQRRAAAYQLNEQHEECVRDWKKVVELDHSHENKRALKDAEKQLKMSKRKDYYKILGLEKGTDSQDDIKKAYRKKAMLHHPDRHASAEPEVREAEEIKFKEVSEAYSVLSDPKKKVRYDNGHDLDELGGMDIDPSDIFASFFGGGGPGMSFTFGGGGHPFGGGGGGPFGTSGGRGGQFFNFSF